MKINGPGRYNDITTEIRERIHAEGVILAVFNGDRGGGFEVQVPGEILMRLPTILRKMADDIEGGGQ